MATAIVLFVGLTLMLFACGAQAGASSSIIGVDKSLLGTKSAYAWIAQPDSSTWQDNQDMTITYEGRTCSAVHVTMLLRHGSRNPGADDMEDIEALAQKIRENRAPSGGDLDFIETWRSTMDPADGDMLNDLGRREMRDIGIRTGQRFKNLLDGNQNRLEYFSSERVRTRESAEFFSEGLAQYLYNANSRIADIEEDNLLLRIYDNCKYFEETVDKNDALMKEVDKFRNSPTFTGMVEAIQTRLGLFANTTLSEDDVEYIWEMCGFQLMWGVPANWCRLMSDQDRNIISFGKDLENYFEDSYGNGVSGQIWCTVLKKMFGFLDAAIDAREAGSNDYTVGSFMFGHSNTVLGAATTFRLFLDNPPLRATDFTRERKFSSADIAPMSGNLGFALYDCGDQTNEDKRYVIKMFQHERELDFPHHNLPVFPYDFYRRMFRVTASCNINALCKYPRDTSGAGTVRMSFLAVLSSLLFLSYTRF